MKFSLGGVNKANGALFVTELLPGLWNQSLTGPAVMSRLLPVFVVKATGSFFQVSSDGIEAKVKEFMFIYSPISVV
jgi:hypothetical protein